MARGDLIQNLLEDETFFTKIKVTSNINRATGPQISATFKYVS
jgi:hypothetical protein